MKLVAGLRTTRAYQDSPDLKAVRIVAWLRLIVVVGVAAGGSFFAPTDETTKTLFLLIGLVWVPWAGIVLLAADNPTRRLVLIGGPVGDVIGLFAVQLLAPGAERAVLFGYLVIVAFAGFTAGRMLAAALAATTFGFTLIATAHAPAADKLKLADLILYGAAQASLLMLARRSASVHALTSARVEGLRTKADVILATVVGGVVVTDSVGRVLESNPAAERIIDSGALVGRACEESLGLHMGSRLLDCSAGCALLNACNGASEGQEVWRLTANGDKQPILASAVPLTTSEGVEVVHSIQDITRLKQAEEAKTLFLATASHELKTPLTVINGFAETLTKYDDLDPETQRMALAAIRTRALELNRVVDRLLLSSRIEAGRVSLVTQEVAIGPILADRADCLAKATERAITCTVSPDLQTVQADPDAFVTVIDHLLDNALKYSPNGGGVTVTATGYEDGALVSIGDSGIGMDSEQASRCFEKFWQAESTDVRRFGGTGIGLYIVHSLVEAMGGRIEVTSSIGKGSTFTIALRAARSVPPPREAGQGESTSIREFMRQIGVPSGGQR